MRISIHYFLTFPVFPIKCGDDARAGEMSLAG